MGREMLGSPELWSELAKLHHRRTHLLLGHFEERIRRTDLEAGLLEVESEAVSGGPCQAVSSTALPHPGHSRTGSQGLPLGRRPLRPCHRRGPQNLVFYKSPRVAGLGQRSGVHVQL